MHCSGELVAIALLGSVFVNDVVAQKPSSLKGTGDDIRVWDEIEPPFTVGTLS
jgi:hypothetical protein